MADLEELARRLEEATGPDRAIDAALFNALPDEREPRTAYKETNCVTLEQFGRSARFHDGWLTRRVGYDGDRWPEDLPRFTASLDAAIALCERVTKTIHPPAWSWRVGNLPSGNFFATLGTSEREHYGRTPAIALTLALVRALQSAPTEGER